MTEKEQRVLQGFDLFRSLTDAERAFAMEFLRARTKEFRSGEYLYHAGDPITAFGLVLSGHIEVYTDDMEGNPTMMNSVCAGQSFAESLCYLGGKNSDIYIVAGTDATVLCMEASPFRTLTANSDPRALRLYDRFVSVLAERTLAMNDRIQILSKKTLRERLIAYFTRCERKSGKNFTVPFDRERLAVYLGVNRSALSRELSRMQSEGLITYYKNTFRLNH